MQTQISNAPPLSSNNLNCQAHCGTCILSSRSIQASHLGHYAVNSHRFIVAGILGVAALVQPQISWGYTAEDISRIAKEVTVVIDGNELGSGVVFGHQEYKSCCLQAEFLQLY